jgi:hypothetical protein
LKVLVSSFIDVLVKEDGVEAFVVLVGAVDVSTLEMPVEEVELHDVEIGFTFESGDVDWDQNMHVGSHAISPISLKTMWLLSVQKRFESKERVRKRGSILLLLIPDWQVF